MIRIDFGHIEAVEGINRAMMSTLRGTLIMEDIDVEGQTEMETLRKSFSMVVYLYN